MVNQTTASPCVGCSRMLPSAPGPSFRFTAVKFESIAPDFVGATVGHSGTSDRRDDPPADLRCWSNRNPSELGPFPPKIHENPWNIMNHHETLGILSWKVWNVEVFLQFKPKPELGASSSCRYTQYLTLSPADTRYVLQNKYQTDVGNSKFWIMFVLDPANRLRIFALETRDFENSQLSNVQTLDCPFKYWFVNSESQFMVMFNHPEYQPRRLITPEINIDQSSCINYVPMLWIVNTPN